MTRLALLGTTTALLAALTLPAPALAARGDGALWATVNVCDTARRPDVLGIRASMPGTGRPGRLFMRFRAQFRAGLRAPWRPAPRGSDSGWRAVGPARFAARESGWSFTFPAPAVDRYYELRGRVGFEWRVGRRVLRRAARITEAGHRSTAGADPASFSAASCRIT